MNDARKYQAALIIAQNVGVGGPTWTVTTPASGLGGTPVSAGTVTGKAVQGKLGTAEITAPGQGITFAPWYFVAYTGALTATQQITDGAYTFAITGLASPNVYEMDHL